MTKLIVLCGRCGVELKTEALTQQPDGKVKAKVMPHECEPKKVKE